MPVETRITDVRTVSVGVSDQDRALQFYVGKLGFENRLDTPMGEGNRWIEVAPPGAATSVALVATSEAVPAGADTGIRFTSGDVDSDHSDLQARGVDVDDVLRWDGVPPMFSFRDQDKNIFYVIEHN